jgi:hypothetical protein
MQEVDKYSGRTDEDMGKDGGVDLPKVARKETVFGNQF